MRARPLNLSVALAAIGSLALTAPQAAAGDDCRTAPYTAAAPCFRVVGRLAFTNGGPAVRLRPRGSRRVLGVVGGEGDAASPRLLPGNVELLSRPPSPGARLDLLGSFEVCPLAPERRGRMRPVCLAAATDLAVSPIQPSLPGGRLPPSGGR